MQVTYNVTRGPFELSIFIGTGGGGGGSSLCATIAGCNGGDTTLGVYTAKGGYTGRTLTRSPSNTPDIPD